MANKNTTHGSYIDFEDSFYLAQIIISRLKARGFNFPPVLALQKELKKIQAQNFIQKRRRKHIVTRFIKKEKNG